MDMIFHWDASVFLWLQDNVRTDALTPFMNAVSLLAKGGALWVLLTLLFLGMRKTRALGAVCFVSLLSNVVILNLLLKNIVARPRPYTMIEGLILAGPAEWDWSFPSGHTGASFAVAVCMLLLMSRKIGIPALILAILISFSRLYIGVHYPTDVICGALIGTSCALFSVKYVWPRAGKKFNYDNDTGTAV